MKNGIKKYFSRIHFSKTYNNNRAFIVFIVFSVDMRFYVVVFCQVYHSHKDNIIILCLVLFATYIKCIYMVLRTLSKYEIKILYTEIPRKTRTIINQTKQL